MKIFGSLVFAFALLFLIATDAQAVTMQDYIKYPGSKEIDSYLSGYLEGMLWANAQLKNTDRAVIFCQPGKLTLYATNLRAIIDNYYQEQSAAFKAKNLPVGAVALNALIVAFPCK